MNYKNLIEYYQSCFEIDNRNFVINDLLKKTSNTYFFRKEELLNDELPMPYVPIPKDKFEEFTYLNELHGGEGKVYYFSFILRGEKLFQNKKSKLFAPLFLFEADLFEKEGHYYVKIDTSNRIVNNGAFIENIKKIEDREFVDNVFNELEELQLFKDIPIFFDQYFDNINNDQCMNFPTLTEEKEILKIYKSRAKKYKDSNYLLPASGLCFLQDRSEIKGIINELKIISEKTHHKSAFKYVFGNEKIKANQSKNKFNYSKLNLAQKRAVINADKYPLSYIIGPPGTGKSFTVASIAIDYILNGKTVLVVSKTDEAVDVIAEKLNNDYNINSSILRSGKKDYQKQLQENLKNILNNVHSNPENDLKLQSKLFKDLHRSVSKLEKNEDEFIKLSQERKKHSRKYFQLKEETGFLKKIIFELLKFKYNSKKSIFLSLEKVNKEIDNNERLKSSLIKIALQNKRSNLAKFHRSTIKTLSNSIKSRTASRRERLQDEIDYKILLNAFPIWLVKMKDIYKSIPLVENLFDIVIIDEATQCDIASTIPILYRGKGVVIAGDPKQIRHMSFVSRKKQLTLSKRFKTDAYTHINQEYLDYRNNSIIDVFSEKIDTNDQISFLNEHFRSLPAIIGFSNKEFYSDSLQIMTKTPKLEHNEGIEFFNVKGSRDETDVNQKEIDFILKSIKAIIEKEKEIPLDLATSIGVLSPFRKQVDAINETIFNALSSSEHQKHQIMVGTAYHFQGNERDTMFISMSLDNSSHGMAFHYLNKAELLNVAITRARTKQNIIYSFDFENISHKNRVRRFFDYYLQPQKKKHTSDFNDEFLEEIIHLIKDKVDEFWVSYSISGMKIDLLLKQKNSFLAIDLIGFPGEFEDIYTLERYKILHRIGIKIYPISYIEWKENQEETIKTILDFIN